MLNAISAQVRSRAQAVCQLNPKCQATAIDNSAVINSMIG
jgi:hypothetical protein